MPYQLHALRILKGDDLGQHMQHLLENSHQVDH